ncbi:TIGR03756 family integrating conjugative element protein [Azotobacter vinelandii]|uniref:TIGR03756 family integrating conjugative element protein n=1 Tax=Azotobacter vinelandii TaxID=354 RepID=UPI000AB203A9|nr:TIGR03756 family integrating conjugative element protein [Azotobacter vinelandii]
MTARGSCFTHRFGRAGLAAACALSLAAAGSLPAQAANFTSANLLQSMLSPDCLEYKVVGVCVWLYCGAGGCRTRTSVKVGHYIPELVVSSYNATGKNPWSEVAALGTPNASAQGGGTVPSRHSHNRDILRFKNVDAIGHPGTSLFSAFASQYGYACKSGTSSLKPHFLSTLDTVGWRQATVEMLYPESYVPGMRELGNLGQLDIWGNIFPRSGFVSQSDDYRGAALTAQRAADFVTRSGQPHVYTPLKPGKTDGWWPPEPVVEGDRKTHKWQPVSPSMEMKCAVWPDKGPLGSYGARIDGSGDYAWTLWRPYSCCRKRGQKLLYHTGTYP